MRVLVIGAYGFIGAHITAGLRAAGHDVTGSGRNVALGRRLMPDIPWIACDLNRDVTPEAWTGRLRGIDAVVNCAGILQASRRDDIGAIHHRAPAALFAACESIGIERVVQISALGVEDGAATGYAESKRAADEDLMARDLGWIVLRPSLVYARGCYGGTALMRGLAALPWIVPLPGGGKQRFQPIHMDDLVRAVVRLLEPGAPTRVLLNPVGPAALTLRDIVLGFRNWLGLPPAPALSVPLGAIGLAARIGDAMHWLGARGSLRTTALRQMARDNVADPAPFTDAVGFAPRAFAEGLAAEPAQVQDRWHARLYFLRPVLRIAIGLFWIATGLVTAIAPGREQALDLIRDYLGTNQGMVLLTAGIAVDIALGLLLLLRYRPRAVATAMIAVSAGYLGMATWFAPDLWFDPLGPLVKILPIAAATLILIAIEDDR
jgi:uncharacterized protein YbjT (DUF2867 family)